MTKEWDSAVTRGDVAALGRLLDGGADPNARDKNGQTALMRAAHQGQAPVVRLLINRGADLDCRAKFDLTALMLAVIGGHAVIVDMLVRSGADLTVTGTGAPGFEGKTALELATGPGRENLERILRGGS